MVDHSAGNDGMDDEQWNTGTPEITGECKISRLIIKDGMMDIDERLDGVYYR